jgi:hypothetical protein
MVESLLIRALIKNVISNKWMIIHGAGNGNYDLHMYL